jgi:hypothetical protein
MLYMDLTFKNASNGVMNGFAIQFNVNSYGLVPSQLIVPELQPSQSANVNLVLLKSGNPQQMNPVNLLQVAIKNNIGVYYFATHIPEQLV